MQFSLSSSDVKKQNKGVTETAPLNSISCKSLVVHFVKYGRKQRCARSPFDILGFNTISLQFILFFINLG